MLSGAGSEKVPAIAGDVEKDRDPSVALCSRLGHELHAAGAHPLVRGVEVVDTQEQANPSRELVADGSALVIAIGLGEEQRGVGPRRPNNDPSLWTAIVRRRRRVFDELEAQLLHEELDGFVVAVDDDRNLLKEHFASRQPPGEDDVPTCAAAWSPVRPPLVVTAMSTVRGLSAEERVEREISARASAHRFAAQDAFELASEALSDRTRCRVRRLDVELETG